MRTDEWIEARLASKVVHLDIAAAGRVSKQVLRAQSAHLTAEASGAYALDEKTAPVLRRGRAALAGMVGLGADDLAFTNSAAEAFAVLLTSWDLPARARVGTTASEFGSNARLLRQLADLRGWEIVVLPADDLGRVTEVPSGLDLIAFPHVASQRGIVQPVADILAADVPVVLDVAQALGQVVVPTGCAAYVGTSRKWLCGPRGVGFAIVDPAWQAGLAAPPSLSALETEGMMRLETHEGHVAGRMGLARAAQEWTPDLMPVVHDLAAHARQVLDGVNGWRVVEPVDEPSGITTLVGGDPFAVRKALLAKKFLTTAVSVRRAEELTAPVLRVSTAAWAMPDDLDALAAALAATRA